MRRRARPIPLLLPNATALLCAIPSAIAKPREDRGRSAYRTALLPRICGERGVDRRCQPDCAERQQPGARGGRRDVDQPAGRPGKRRRSRFTGQSARTSPSATCPRWERFIRASWPSTRWRWISLPTRAAGSRPADTVGVRKALNDGVADHSVPTKEAAQKQADALMKPYIEQMALKLPD